MGGAAGVGEREQSHILCDYELPDTKGENGSSHAVTHLLDRLRARGGSVCIYPPRVCVMLFRVGFV